MLFYNRPPKSTKVYIRDNQSILDSLTREKAQQVRYKNNRGKGIVFEKRSPRAEDLWAKTLVLEEPETGIGEKKGRVEGTAIKSTD